MDTSVVVHLGDEDLVSVHVHASIDVAGTEVARVWHAMCLDPADRTWIPDKDFVLVESVALVLSTDFCALA